ncbi:hypothetical protein OZN62_05805 [Aurantiacibacter sp. MUD11]|uniref:hypothetical protein n=1 Tax=Aurantiacibacter sp. MUD11 TaxID=3003265 RepID=UPI0022AAA06F|nr:hypothetical protein [Aurantiacibacter sp. MUD11]WAT19079.1 hypothetical protein OZN62_05805 [Aurantiacibacter sp. MUD11]
MKLWVAGISAVALAVVPALAQGNGRGNGQGGNVGPSAAAERGNGQANDNRGASANADRGARGNGPAEARGNRAGPAPESNAGRGPDTVRGNGGGREAQPARGNGAGNAGGNRGGNGASDIARITYAPAPTIEFRLRANGVADGCPPGLARKYNGCRPPGLARQQDGDRYRRYAPDWWGLGSLLRDVRGSYFYDDGYLLRLGLDGQISGYIPLLGGALSIGNPWPADYRYARLPSYYESYYGLGRPEYYRYADNVVYRLDPETAAITSIAAMLTGDEFVVGQRAPDGYDIYNVPYSYRDRYYDRPGARYRYNNGYVYEIDPETMLVVAAIELLI